MRILKDLEQDTADWHQRRRKSIGSSDASVIMRCDPYRTYEQLVVEKRDGLSSFRMNAAMALGKKWEGAAREMFNILFDYDVQPIVGVHHSLDFILASFDGLCEETKVFVEIKYIGHKKLDILRRTNRLPDHHIAQTQHQFLVSGFEKAYYIAYALSDCKSAITRIEYIEIKRDEAYLEKLLNEEERFWGIINERNTINSD